MKPSEYLIKYGSDKATHRNYGNHHYGEFYDDLFSQFPEPFNLLEIGVLHGQSLRAWREAFPKSRITGIDIMDLKEPIEGVIFIQGDVKKITLTEDYDVIIDDSSHDLRESLYEVIHFTKNLTDQGVLIIEDVQIPDDYVAAYRKVLPEGFKLETFDFRSIAGRHDDYIVKISRV